MIYLLSDYSQGAHPEVLEALTKTNFEHTDGYSLDRFCEEAEATVKELIGRDDCKVHMMVGGTPTNIITIASALRPYEAVVSPKTAHIYKHECGGVEATGHKIIAMETEDGKLTPELIDKAWLQYEDEHTVIPKMVYITHATEIGTVYTKAELVAIRECCDKHDMYLYLDGARLAAGLTCPETDLTIQDIAQMVDAFYIGGTKCGAMMGEALVIFNDEIGDHFRWMLKRLNGMLAKGRLIGVQMNTLLKGGEDSLMYKIGRKENEQAKRLKEGLIAKGYKFMGDSVTNQIFPILSNEQIEKLQEDFFFLVWEPYDADNSVVRFVTSWGTTDEEIDALLAAL